MIEIEARSGFNLPPHVQTWNYLDSCRSEFKVGICNLLKQLSKSKSAPLLNTDEFWSACRQERTITALAIDYGNPLEMKVAGMAMMFIHQKFSVINGYIEDVVVDENYQRQGIAVKLMEKLLEVAQALHLKSVNLSSGNGPDRAAAHKLYLKLGFEKRDSTLFRKKL
ncbi:MAG: GNAT family N-acetyltransferase [bacterium]|nr:GNAT family N-acetyltransferase [bacterium]